MKILILVIATLLFNPLAQAKSFEFQHDIVFEDRAGIYPGFTINANGKMGKYCSFSGYLGDESITPAYLDGSPVRPLRAPIILSKPLSNTIYKAQEREFKSYERADGTIGRDFVTSISSRIHNRKNSYVHASCRVPAHPFSGEPIDYVPTLDELREMFKDYFSIVN